MYIRLQQISVLGNHPFTIASMPASKEDKAARKQNELMFLVRAQAEFTHTLANMVERSSATLPVTGPGTPTALASPVEPDPAATPEPDLEKAASDNCATPPPLAPCRPRVATLRTLVNGPYGGHMRPLHRLYDAVVCVAGAPGVGTGLSQGGDDASASSMGVLEEVVRRARETIGVRI